MTDCAGIEHAVLHGESVADPAARAHLAECDSCRFLASGGAPVAQALIGSTPPATPVDLASLESQVMVGIRGDAGALAAVRAMPRIVRVGLFAAVAGLAALFYASFMLRPDFAAYTALRMALTIGGYGALALALSWASLRPLYLPPASSLATRTLVGLGLAAPIVAALLPLEPMHVTLGHYHVIPYAWYCFGIGAAISGAVLLAARALSRDGHSGTRPALMAAAAAGLVGVLGGQLECPITLREHLLLGHATIPLGVVAASLLFRRLQ